MEPQSVGTGPLYLYSICIVLLLYFNRAVTVHNYRYPRVAGKKDNISSLAVMIH